MARCCATRDAHCMPVLPTPSKASSQKLPRTGPSCWRVTALMPVLSKRLRVCGARPGSDHWRAPPWSKRSTSSRAPSTNLRHCPDTPALRRDQIKLQVGLATALYHVEGFRGARNKSGMSSKPVS